MRKGTLFALVVVAGLLVASMPMVGQEKTNDQHLKEVMEAYSKFADPGEHHARLEALVGLWDIKGRFRMGPNQPWTNFHAVTEIESILGGRFVTSRALGGATEWMPRPYEGFSVMGYDNYKKKFSVVALENYSTAMQKMEGGFDQSTQTINFVGTTVDPVAAVEKSVRYTMKFDKPDRLVHTFYNQDEHGAEFIFVEETSTRRVR